MQQLFWTKTSQRLFWLFIIFEVVRRFCCAAAADAIYELSFLTPTFCKLLSSDGVIALAVELCVSVVKLVVSQG